MTVSASLWGGQSTVYMHAFMHDNNSPFNTLDLVYRLVLFLADDRVYNQA